MTEDDWLRTIRVGDMLTHLGGRVSLRKLRLFVCAVHRLELRPDWDQERRALDIAERYADGLANSDDLVSATSRWDPEFRLSDARLTTLLANHPGYFGVGDDPITKACLVHEIFGNPFRPMVLDPDWLTWNDGCVRNLAQGIYDARRFRELPILADALEDAGCTAIDLLAHLRNGLRHFRGCWALDVLLCKT
jgi:hypothetical protein